MASLNGAQQGSAPARPYTYTPLQSPHSIRLVRLLPSLDPSSPIQCRVMDYPLKDDDNGYDYGRLYDAISYVWGPTDPPCYLSIISDTNSGHAGHSGSSGSGGDGSNMRITPNLHAALHSLRNRSLERTLWIDAICINQGDEVEKGKQIGRMAEIYHRANRVIVWLGEEGTRTSTGPGKARALDDLRRIAAAANAGADNSQWREVMGSVDLSEQALAGLLSRGWFERVWILQEVAAARNILIKCGSAELDGYVFASGLEQLRHYLPDTYTRTRPVAYLIRDAIFRPPTTKTLLPAPPTLPFSSAGASVGNNGTTGAANAGRFTFGLRPLGELIYMYRDHRATQRRDKIFALLGMAIDDAENGIERHLVPNYSMEWTDLLRELVRVLFGAVGTAQLSVSVRTTSDTHPELALLRTECWIVGRVNSMEEDKETHEQMINIRLTDGFASLGVKRDWDLPPSPNPVETGDLFCLPRGATQPVIVRPRGESLFVVMFPEVQIVRAGEVIDEIAYDVQLVWDWREQPLDEEPFAALGVDGLSSRLTASSHRGGGQKGGDDLWDWATTLEGTASVLFDTGSNEASGNLLKKLVHFYESQLPPDNMRALGAKDKLARSYIRLERWDEAKDLMEPVVEARTRLQGTQHPATVFSRVLLVVIRHCMPGPYRKPLPGPFRRPTLIELEKAVKVLERRAVQSQGAVANASETPTEDELFALLRCFDEVTTADLITGKNKVEINQELVEALCEMRPVDPESGHLKVWWNLMTYLLRSSSPKVQSKDTGERVSVTGDGIIAVMRFFGAAVLTRWLDMLDQSNTPVKITQRILIVAAEIKYRSGLSVMECLIDKKGNSFTITEPVVLAAVKAWSPPDKRQHGEQKPALEVLLDKRPDEVQITAGLISAAEENDHDAGDQVIRLLLRDSNGNPTRPVTETMILQAAKLQVFSVLYELLEANLVWRHVEITEDMVKTARQNAIGRGRVLGAVRVLEEYRDWMLAGKMGSPRAQFLTARTDEEGIMRYTGYRKTVQYWLFLFYSLVMAYCSTGYLPTLGRLIYEGFFKIGSKINTNPRLNPWYLS